MNCKVYEISPNCAMPSSILCNLNGETDGLQCDFIVGMLPHFYDASVNEHDDNLRSGKLVWYHWTGSDWRETTIAENYPPQVGLAAADITGNGKLDIIFAEWTDFDWMNRGKPEPTGDIYWAEQPKDPFKDRWIIHVLGTGCFNSHDILTGNIGGNHEPDVVVRNKHGKISWFAKPGNPRDRWEEIIVADAHAGDGTAIFDITGNGSCDIITGSGYYENVDGNGRGWRFVPLGVDDLELHPELRVEAGCLLDDGSVSIVITESELYSEARILILTSLDKGQTWMRKVLIDKDRDFRALHTLKLYDVDGDGLLDIFTTEMEHGKTDGVTRKPKWIIFYNKGNLEFEEFTLLDANLGGHQGCLGPISRSGKTDFIAKDWKSNKVNGCNGNNHFVHIQV